MDNSYPKKEKLCSKIIIDKLFNGNRPVYDFPLKIFWLITELPADVPAQSVVSASKRRFKKAVDRNLLKRRMREAFRLNKHQLYQTLKENNLQLALMIIYNTSEIENYKKIEAGMIKALSVINQKIQKQLS